MSLSKPPSFVSVDEEKGKVTVAFLASWYNKERCSGCPRFKYTVDGGLEVGYCEQIEADEACEVTGIRHVGEKDWR